MQKPRTKADAARLERWSALSSFVGSGVRVSFDGVSFDTRLTSYGMARLADVVNTPEKRDDGGKLYTPRMIALTFADGIFYLVDEDVARIDQLTRGTHVTMVGGLDIKLERLA